ncbi:hypothetical protein BDZ89DRAFT_1072762 [Hymenopellis radicata]|nr:hypothetical protein BDZ89DRAFT_1072762 [Hymenopellis radicata]
MTPRYGPSKNPGDKSMGTAGGVKAGALSKRKNTSTRCAPERIRGHTSGKAGLNPTAKRPRATVAASRE